jgi:putative membrane protein
MPKLEQQNISEAIKQRSTDALAFGRTAMANERTLLAFLRTGIGLLGGGIGIVGFVELPFIVALGWLAIAVSVPLLIWGIWRYIKMKRLLKEVGSEIFFPERDPE